MMSGVFLISVEQYVGLPLDWALHFCARPAWSNTLLLDIVSLDWSSFFGLISPIMREFARSRPLLNRQTVCRRNLHTSVEQLHPNSLNSHFLSLYILSFVVNVFFLANIVSLVYSLGYTARYEQMPCIIDLVKLPLKSDIWLFSHMKKNFQIF